MSGAISATRVFISAKSEDYEYAALVFSCLLRAGFAPFFSRESLPHVGSADYRREIDRALDQAQHLVVVTSRVEHAVSPWVEAEWGFFINEKRSGRKPGNLVTMVVGDLKPADLPPSLRYHEVLPFDPPEFGRLLHYLGDPALIQSAEPSRSLDRRPNTFRPLATLGGPPRILLIRASEPANLVATGGFDGALRLYDLRTRSRVAVLGSSLYWASRHEALITALEFSADGRHLASGHLDGAVHLWDVQAQCEVGRDLGHEAAVGSLAFSPDGRTLATAARDGVVRYWDIAVLGREAGLIGAATRPAAVLYLGYLPRASWLLIGLVNTETGQSAFELEPGSSPGRTLATVTAGVPFRHVAISSDEAALVTAGHDGMVRLYDLAAVADALKRQQSPRMLPLVGELAVHGKPASSVTFMPDGRSIITSAMDSSLALWELTTRAPLLRLQGEAADTFVGAAVLRNGALLAGALADGRVMLWEAA